MPSNFTVGDYRFVMVYNGTGYAYTSDGSPMVNLGYNLVFNITQGSEAQTVMFGSAPPAPYPPGVPSPSTATPFDGNVHMQWVATCTAIFFEITIQPALITGTSVNSSSNTFLTQCSITGIGGFQFRVVSDSTGAPVNGETINAVDRLGCDIVGQAPEAQLVYLDNFSVGQGGWLTPIFPYPAEPGGELNFTVSYQGETYTFSAVVPPIGTSCVTLHVPSGTVSTTTTMNGPCSSTPPPNSSEQHNVTFQQVGAGACPFLGEPWAVTIGNMTKVQPAGTTLPLNDGGPLSGTNNTNISNIYFSLPPGTYQYQIHPSFEFFTPSSGTLNLNATSNIVVKIAYTGHGCISTSNK